MVCGEVNLKFKALNVIIDSILSVMHQTNLLQVTTANEIKFFFS